MGIVGESGSGKSTLLKAIAGLLPQTAAVTSGSVELDGIDLLERDGKEMRAMRGSEIGFLFQDTEGSFDPLFTIKKQFDEVMNAHRREPKDRCECDRIQRKALDLVGLRDADRILSSLPSELSGGMCQQRRFADGSSRFPPGHPLGRRADKRAGCDISKASHGHPSNT